MTFIETLKEGQQVQSIYLAKHIQNAMTKTGKPYQTVTLQDKTGAIDGKIWDLSSMGIDDFDELDYIAIAAEVTSFNGALQLNIKRVRKAQEGEYIPSDYLPTSDRDIEEMYSELLGIIDTVKAPYMKELLYSYFKNDAEFKKVFCFSSAAKSVHHGYVGGLLEHTLSVANVCDFFSKNYPHLDRDLLVSAAILHDIGKTREISPYPENDYTDEGQLLGHIMIGANMVAERIKSIPDFPKTKAMELQHCILAHHGELEFGSPKKPAIVEAIALSFADNVDAKMETFKEAMSTVPANNLEWQGFNRFLDSNIRRTSAEKN